MKKEKKENKYNNDKETTSKKESDNNQHSSAKPKFRSAHHVFPHRSSNFWNYKQPPMPLIIESKISSAFVYYFLILQ